MPLSEHEQQILAEMERNLRSDEPGVGPGPGGGGSDSNRIKLAAFIFILGIFLLVGFFVSGLVIVGVFAFGAMVGAIVLGTSGVSRLLTSAEEDGKSRAQRAFSQWEERLRRRYRGR